MCSITGEKLYYKDIGTSRPKRRLLPEKYRRLFANKQIVCVEYQDITDSDEREIFQVRFVPFLFMPHDQPRESRGCNWAWP